VSETEEEAAMTLDEGAAYRSDEEVEEVLRSFEGCTLSPDEFKHRPHLTVALAYALRHPEAEALALMRQSIRRFIGHHGIPPDVYHETLTVFWVRRVLAFVAGRAGGGGTLCGLANALAKECGDSRLVYEYFSKELIDSAAARGRWVEPDLKPLDF
jgi:hypothetical protein